MCKLPSVRKNVKLLLEKNRVRTENVIVPLYFLISSVLVTQYPRGYSINLKWERTTKVFKGLRTLHMKSD